MKVKELHKTVNVAWSPPSQHPILMAAGTAAQQLDASFSTNASLDLYLLNLQQPGYDMQLSTSVMSDQRFHKIIWGACSNDPAGIIVGGCDYGKIKIYSASKMLANDNNCLISSSERHEGPVKAMDLNPFQPNLLATGSTQSEIFIWDLNTNKPMSPGSKSVPEEDVQHIEWNKQVQHILASTFSQRCVIWDLRKNEAIIKLTDANSRVRWKCVQWHPDVATQLCLASEEDQTPIIELWDLRFAASPLKTLHNHQRGVLSIAWNAHDSDLLLSCAKDNRILCWNPNSEATNGEVICELAQTSQWNFDVSWCPRHPGLIVGSSFDGLATVYSLLGGHNQGSPETSNKIVDSFPGMDPFTQPPPSVQAEATAFLKKAPKWLKKPFGASFGFGGKLTIFENEPIDSNMPVNSNRKVFVSQVILNPELIQRSNELEAALKTGQFSDFCKGKIDNANDEHKKKVWSCVGAYFGENVTQDLLELLGFNIDEMNNKLNKYLPQQEVEAVTDGISKLNNQVMNGNAFDGSSAFDAIAEQEQSRLLTPKKIPSKVIETSFNINTSDDDNGLITQAILLGNIEAAVSLCFANKRYADAVILSMTGGPDLLAQTQYRYFMEHTGALNSLINSLVSENWGDVVKNCDINCWKEAIVGVFTHTNPEERSALCDILGDRLAQSNNVNLKKEAQICYICSGNLNKAVESSESDIQETVELITILQRALEFHSMRKIDIEGNIATILTRYAEMLAAEGDLDAALSYLGNSQEQRIVMLRDRLYNALGHIRAAPPGTNLSQNPPTQNMYARNEPRKSLPGMVQSMTMPVQNQYPQQQSWNVTPTKQTSYGGVPSHPYGGNLATNPPYSGSVVTNTPYGGNVVTNSSYGGSVATNTPYGGNVVTNQPYGSIPPAPTSQFTPAVSPTDSYGQYGQTPLTPSVPPPPPSTNQGSSLSNSRPPSAGPPARAKYLLDPSVKSGTTYGSSGFPQTQQVYPGAQQQQSQQQQQAFPTAGSFPAQSTYPIQQQQSMGNLGSYARGGAQSTIYNPVESEIQQQRNSQPNMLNPINPMTPQNIYDPSAVQQQPVQPLGYPNENIYQSESQSSGWNDPPISSKTSKAQPVLALLVKNEMCAEHAGSRKWKEKYTKGVDAKTKSEFHQQDPILQPLRGAPQPEPNVYQQTPGYQQNYQDPQAMYNQYNHNIPPQGVQGVQGIQGVQGVQQFNRPTETLQPVQPTPIIRPPEPEKQKAPIPPENEQLQIVFNELKDRCSENAKIPQLRKKIDDVYKKLEVFYDCLREKKISQNTLQGLHQICNLVKQGDYSGGLAVHTQLVSGPDFSQIASFMPGIKILLQCAQQLGVYIR